jgi:hypothetical protein
VGEHALTRAELRWLARLPRLGGLRARIEARGAAVALADAIAEIHRVPPPPSRRLCAVHAELRQVGREMRQIVSAIAERGPDVDVTALTAAGAAYRAAVEHLPLEPET